MGTSSDRPEHLSARRRMVERQIAARGLADPLILEAMGEVPRHLFLDADMDPEIAYGDHPVPIGFGQTISQPFIIALMIHDMGLHPGERVLEIGTGSGYQTAILAFMGMRVTSIDILPALCISALVKIRRLGLSDRCAIIAADGYHGWEPGAPYDGIVVSASPPSLPPALPGQLSRHGRLVLPVGINIQHLVRIENTPEGFRETRGEPVRFVPLVPVSGCPGGIRGR